MNRSRITTGSIWITGTLMLPVIQMDPVVIRDRFKKEIQSRNG